MKSAGVPENAYPSRTKVTRDWFNERGLYRARGTYTPKPGDYVVFGNVAHCGIVESVSGGYVTTIEGNSSDQVRRNTYAMTNTYILGYGIINYNGASSGGNTSTGTMQTNNPGSPYPIPTSNLRSGNRGNDVKWVQQFANEVMGAGITVDGVYGNQTIYAVRVFQQNNGLTVDGICGAQTTAKMLTAWRNKLKEKHNPQGAFDLAEGTNDGKLHVRGWMYDPDAVAKSNTIHVYIGGPAGTKGAECHAVIANTSRKDVDKAYHVGEFHGFDTVIDTKKTGNQAVYIYGINEGEGTTNPEIGHKTVNIPIPKKECEHVYTKYVSNNDATCGKDGTKTAVCDKCHEAKNTVTDEGSATGEHDWDKGTVIKEATYDETGTMEYKCEVCGTVKYEVIPVVEKPEDTETEESSSEENPDESNEETTEIKENISEEPEDSTEKDITSEEVQTENTEKEPEEKEEGTAKNITPEEEQEENTEKEPEEKADSTEKNIPQEEQIKEKQNTSEEVYDDAVNSDMSQKITVETSQNAPEESMNKDRKDSYVWTDDDSIDVEAPVIKKVSNVKKRSIKIKLVPGNDIDGYEYAVVGITDKNLKKFKRQVAMSDGERVTFKGVKTYSTKSYTVKLSGLKKGKKYAVTVRAYKVVNNERIYGEYSAVKCVKIKK